MWAAMDAPTSLGTAAKAGGWGHHKGALPVRRAVPVHKQETVSVAGPYETSDEHRHPGCHGLAAKPTSVGSYGDWVHYTTTARKQVKR